MRHILLALVGALGFASSLHGSARSTAGIDWDFESSGSGWTAQAASFDTSAPPHTGAGAARLIASGLVEPMQLHSSLWLVPTVPGAQLSATLWVSAVPDDVASIRAELQVFGSDGRPVDAAWAEVRPSGSYAQLTIAPRVALEGAAFARVAVFAPPRRTGAALHIDTVSLVEARPTATATGTSTAVSTATSTSTTAATATSTATAATTATSTRTATSTATATATATRTVTPAPTPSVFGALTNGDFEDARALYGWTAQGGAATVGSAPVSSSRAALLTSTSGATKWLHQAVTVTPEGWYTASARLAAGANDEAWLRLAWYVSEDGSGAQLGTVDSPPAPAEGGSVHIGPTRAPSNARSVRVRLVLRPASDAATTLAADDVTLTAAAAPSPTPSPTLTPRATATPIVNAAAPSTEPRTPQVALRSASGVGPAGAAGSGNGTDRAAPPVTSISHSRSSANAPRSDLSGSILRITELLPDPVQEGLDGDYEWVELANLGGASVALDGLVLQDNAAAAALPPLTLSPGDVLVVGGPRADTGAAALVHLLPGAIGNGLGNGGDRLALLSAEGAIIDAVSWGSDRSHLEGLSEVPAPGPGRSLLRRFTDDGSLVSVERSNVPTPGRADDSIVRIEEAPAPVELSSASGSGQRGWVALASVAAGALGWTVVRRAREAQHAAG